jgi:drug/metabolite transporter (DMT)-like permease
MSDLAIRAMPAVFVLLWSTGFIGAKYGLPYVDPLTFLAVRFAIVTAILLPVALVTRARWPADLKQAGHVAVVGLLVHATYLGGVFSAIDLGLPAGVAALIVALQPLVTAVVVGPILGERVTARQALGFVLGLAGVTTVLGSKVAAAPGEILAFQGFGVGAVLCAVAALFGITAGTIYQKRFCADLDLRASTVIQYIAAGIATGTLAPVTGTLAIQWTAEFVFALAWLTLVLSIGAISLLMLLIRRGAAARTASLFYLVPPSTALIAYIVFGETLGPAGIAGVAVTAIGVAMVFTGQSASTRRRASG